MLLVLHMELGKAQTSGIHMAIVLSTMLGQMETSFNHSGNKVYQQVK